MAKLALEMIVGGARHQHAAGLAELLQPRGHDDAVSQEVIPLHDDVAEIDADPKDDPAIGRQLGLLRPEPLLDRHGAGHSIDDGAELDDGPIAHQLDDATVALAQERVDQLAAQTLDRGQRAGLVGLDQPRVADDVGGHDRDEPPLLGCRHGRAPGPNDSMKRA